MVWKFITNPNCSKDMRDSLSQDGNTHIVSISIPTKRVNVRNHLKKHVFLQHDLDDARVRAEEANEAAKSSERRAKDHEAQCIGLQEDLSASERARRQAQQERDELIEEINSAAMGK